MPAVQQPTLRTPQDRAKWAAARYAADTYCFDGARLGLGSGTTSHLFVRALAERVRDGLRVVGVPTSTATADLARQLSIPLAELDEVQHLDVCLDGLDAVDPTGSMIKGGGACLLWEKLVATSSARWIGLADPSKVVARLGAFPLPVEITPFSHRTTVEAVRALLGRHGYPRDVTITRRDRDGAPVVTDNGNYLIDIQLGVVLDAPTLAVQLNTIPGVVENGLFIGIVDEIVVGRVDETATAYQPPLPTSGLSGC